MKQDYSFQEAVRLAEQEDPELYRLTEELKKISRRHTPPTIWITCKLCNLRFRHRGAKQLRWEKLGKPPPIYCNVCRHRMRKLGEFYDAQDRVENRRKMIAKRKQLKGFDPAADLL